VGTIGFTVKLALTVTPPLDAVITTGVIAVTVPAVAVKDAVVAPCTTVTEAGTEAAPLELVSATVTPPAGAGMEMVTAPWLACPLRIEFGVTASAVGTIGFTVKLALVLTPLAEAVRAVVVTEVTVPAVAVKVAVVAPCNTFTEGERETAAFELESETVMPPVGAGTAIVTVPWLVWPLRIEAGVRLTLVGTMGFTVRFAVTLAPPLEAVSTTGVVVVTVPAVAVKVAVVAPCATVTEAGTEAAAFELERVTRMPPAGAGAAIVTVPCVVCELKIAPEVSATPVGTIGLTVKLALRLTPPLDAVIAALVIEVTVPAVAVKLAVIAPGATVTEPGTDAAALELESVRVTPPEVAGAEMVTVP
jgi:hypothetical protein